MPRRPPPTPPTHLRERILADFTVLRIPLTAAQLDATLAEAAQNGLSHLDPKPRLVTES